MSTERTNQIDIKDIHQTFWRCRDFELSNLWQRSIFLTAFLVICFTAYGTALVKLLEQESIDSLPFIGLSVAEYIISLLGLIFSILWIKMSKGSKAWYEVYESAINALETNGEYATPEARKIGGFSYATLPGYRGVRINNSLLSAKAGEYSVSKLNIGIGQVFMFLWSILAIVHTAALAISIHSHVILGCLDVPIAVAGVLLWVTIIFLFARNKTFQSTSIADFKKSNPYD